jgi:hypothetical protein
MGQQQECAKYIVLIGNAFDKYFKTIDVVPVLKKENAGKRTIYFQRTDVLTDASMRAERQQVCNTIGFFFTRLFQIVAALSHSVFDSAAIRTGTDIYGILPATVGPGGPERGGPWIGGGQLNGTPLEVFDKHVIPQGPGSFLMPLRDFPGETLRIMLNQQQQVTGRTVLFRILYRTSSSHLAYDVEAETTISRSGGTFSMKIVQLKLRVGGASTGMIQVPYINTYDISTFTFVTDPIARDITTRKHVEADYKYRTVPRIMREAMKYMLRWGDKLVKNDKTVPPFWSDEDRVLLSEREGMPAYAIPGAAAVAAAARGPGAAAPVLRGLVSASRPLAHCVARSLQLLSLDIAGPVGGRKAWSYVCKPTFAATGIPEVGSRITDDEAIKSLDILYSVFSQGKMMYPPQTGEYLSFLRRMSATFGGTGAVPTTVDSIRFSRDATTCRGRAQGQPIAVRGEGLAAAEAGVQRLWERQIVHAREVTKILGQIFIKDKTGRIALHPQLLQVGVVGLDIIAGATRKLLLEYYTSCEGLYQDAVTQMLRLPGAGAGAGA